MQRIQYHHYGGPDEMRLEEFALPSPGPRQVIVSMRAASVNPMDLKMRRGNMKILTGRRFPRPMGMDLSGVVEAVGRSVTRLQVGDEVLGTARMWPSGAFAEKVLTNEKLLVAKPNSISFELAATLPTVGIAAERGLVEAAKLRHGGAVFVHGCLGGVGQAAVQIALGLGAVVSGSCRGEAMEDARKLGIDPVVDFTTFDPEALKGRFDVVFDTVGKLSWRTSRLLLRPGGICLGTDMNAGKLLRGVFGGKYKIVAAIPSTERLKRVAELAAAGILAPRIGRAVPLTAAIAAIRALEETGRSSGKLVITNPG